MKTKKIPLFLCVKDMMIITGKSKSAVCRIRALIRKHFDKKISNEITIEDFCAFTGLSEEKVNGLLG